MSDRRNEFCTELLQLLDKYKCHIQAKDHWQGYAECGQDVRMTVEFDDWQLADIDLTSSVHADGYIDLTKPA